MYSWNDQKPTVTVGTVVTYNIVQHTFKGSASVNLLGGQPVAPTIPANAEQFIVGVSDVSTMICRSCQLKHCCVCNTVEPLIADTKHFSCFIMLNKMTLQQWTSKMVPPK